MSSYMHQYSPHILVKDSFNGALAASTQNGTGVDTLMARRAGVIVTVTTGAATTANFQLQDSPDNATWTNVAGGTLGTAVPASTADFVQIVDVDLAKRQRYLRVQIIGTGTAGSAVAAVHLYNTGDVPVTQSQTPIVL